MVAAAPALASLYASPAGPPGEAGSFRITPFRDYKHLPRRHMCFILQRGLTWESCFWRLRPIYFGSPQLGQILGLLGQLRILETGHSEPRAENKVWKKEEGLILIKSKV